MTCSRYRIKSVTALTQLNVKLAKHTSPGRLSETNHVITGQTPGGPLPSNSNPAVQPANTGVQSSMFADSETPQNTATLQLETVDESHTNEPQFIEVYPSAREESTSIATFIG